MYTGYNEVTTTGGRTRAACLAHARRRFFEALPYAPEARTALELIRDVYVVEHDAKADGIAGTDAHRQLRRARSKPIMGRLHAWIQERANQYAPKSPMASAVRYALNNWQELTRFLDDARIPPDNNRSESALWIVALGRKNFLFVGHEDAGENLAGLYSLVATCEANEVEPISYLTDVLGRLGSHPAAALDELLPRKWRPSG
jgi:transposase